MSSSKLPSALTYAYLLFLFLVSCYQSIKFFCIISCTVQETYVHLPPSKQSKYCAYHQIILNADLLVMNHRVTYAENTMTRVISSFY